MTDNTNKTEYTIQQWRDFKATDISNQQWQAILLRLGGTKYADIGAQLDVSAATVSAWLRKPHIAAQYDLLIESQAAEAFDHIRLKLPEILEGVANVALTSKYDSARINATKLILAALGRDQHAKKVEVTHTVISQIQGMIAPGTDGTDSEGTESKGTESKVADYEVVDE